MFFALFHKSTGQTLGLVGPSLEWAQGEALERGQEWDALAADHAVDNDLEHVDVSGDQPVLVAQVRERSQDELRIDVNRERGRRLVAGKVFDGVQLTGSDDDIRNLTNLALGAQLRLLAGDTTQTIFRDGDNTDHSLTPEQIISLWMQSSAYVSDLYAKSWALKAMEPIPSDFTNDIYWQGANP
jgi:hypothetical protein